MACGSSLKKIVYKKYVGLHVHAQVTIDSMQNVIERAT